jgi:two-component system NtrC family sensor kinase
MDRLLVSRLRRRSTRWLLAGRPGVTKRRPIRGKLFVGGLLVVVLVAVLSASSFLGVYSYRRLVRALSSRAAELPRASQLNEAVVRLRVACLRDVDIEAIDPTLEPAPRGARDDMAAEVTLVEEDFDERPFGDRSQERQTARELEGLLHTIHDMVIVRREPVQAIVPMVDRLATLAVTLPSFLQQRLHDLSHEVRIRYRTLIILTWSAATAAVTLLITLGLLTYRWIFRPLRLLGNGSRRVAAGDFDHLIRLDTADEMAELAEALNGMTARFREIRDDLDRQVRLRTREVIRSEQLASVGFLAAGVAHEINNPLASIAMCAESLESRLESSDAIEAAAVFRRYLQLIQTEAFRCKEITEKLLDFSRLGEVRRQATALRPLVADVAEMLRHVGRFANRRIEIPVGAEAVIMANPQEVKQVVLNLLVNALDSIEETGRVEVLIGCDAGLAHLSIRDDGCGMTDDILQHIFEPFFTRRKSGQGTGLGLSIVHRIVTDHGGRIEVESHGAGRGACFRVQLPLAGSHAAGEPWEKGRQPHASGSLRREQAA